jgi:hypothetical protein
MFNQGYKLVHPSTKECVAIFLGYSDTGSEVWITVNGIEHCTFQGFTDDGATLWSQSVEAFSKIATELLE